jgi:hypothetical protein
MQILVSWFAKPIMIDISFAHTYSTKKDQIRERRTWILKVAPPLSADAVFPCRSAAGHDIELPYVKEYVFSHVFTHKKGTETENERWTWDHDGHPPLLLELAGRAEVTVVAWTANVDSVESGAGGAPTSRYSRQRNALLPSSATSSSAYVTHHASSLPDRYSDKQPQKVREKPMKFRPYQWQQGRNEAAVLAQELQIPRKHDYIPRGMHQSMVNSGSITANHKLFSRKPSISITYIF